MSIETSFEDIAGSAEVARRVAERGQETDRKTQLRRMRRAAGLSQAALAEAAGWSQPYVSRLERFDGRTPTLDVMEKWARACGFAGELRVFGARGAQAPEVVAAWAV
jgi:transcriptional regulator with XRE-family HTH domain